MNDEDKSKPLTLDDLEAEAKQVPQKRLKMHRGFPIGCGSTGISLGKAGKDGVEKPRHYSEESETPDGEVIGARVVK